MSKTAFLIGLLALSACAEWQSPVEPEDKQALFERHQGGLNASERAYVNSKQ